jgi:hypothetical protein
VVFQALTSEGGTAARLERDAQEETRFLVSEFGFTGQVVREANRTILAYILPPVFFELELDWHENAAFLLVGRSEDGSLPGGYYVDETGRKVRSHLASVLGRSSSVELRKASSALRSIQKESGADAMLAQIGTSARVLRGVVSDIPALVRALDSVGG